MKLLWLWSLVFLLGRRRRLLASCLCSLDPLYLPEGVLGPRLLKQPQQLTEESSILRPRRKDAGKTRLERKRIHQMLAAPPERLENRGHLCSKAVRGEKPQPTRGRRERQRNNWKEEGQGQGSKGSLGSPNQNSSIECTCRTCYLPWPKESLVHSLISLQTGTLSTSGCLLIQSDREGR